MYVCQKLCEALGLFSNCTCTCVCVYIYVTNTVYRIRPNVSMLVTTVRRETFSVWFAFQLAQNRVYYWLFALVQIICCFYMSAYIYYMGRWTAGNYITSGDVTSLTQNNKISAVKTKRRCRYTSQTVNHLFVRGCLRNVKRILRRDVRCVLP